MRFLSAASLFHAIDPLGDSAAQISLLGTVLPLAITEHIGIDSPYRRVANQRLQERARQRLAGAQFYTEYLSELRAPHMLERAKSEHLIVDIPKTDPDPKAPPQVRVKGKGGKGNNAIPFPIKLLVVPARALAAGVPPTPRRNRTHRRNKQPSRQQQNKAQNQQPFRRQQQLQNQKGAGRWETETLD